MKKITSTLTALAMAATVASAATSLPNAIYVVKGDSFSKYNYGVAGDLVFSDGGKTLTVTGYESPIKLDEIDYITFEAPIRPTLTEAQQKERLLSIGEKVNSYVDLDSNADLLNMIHWFFDCFNVEGHYHHAPVHYEVPEEYWSVHGEARNIIRLMGKIAAGNPAAVRALVPRVVNLYKIEDYTGVYTASEKRHEWLKTADADYLEIRFESPTADMYAVRLTPSKEFSRYDVTDVHLQIPSTIDIAFTHGSAVLATANIAITAVQDKSIDLSLKCTTNSYDVDNTLKIVNSGLFNEVKVWAKGTLLVESTTTVSGRDLLNYDCIKDDIAELEGDWDDNGYEYEDGDATPLLSHLSLGVSKVDILGELQVRAMGHNPVKLYKDLCDDDDEIYERIVNGLITYPRGKVLNISNDKSIIDYLDIYDASTEWYEKAKKTLNNYSDAAFFYDNKPSAQGFVGFDVSSDVWEYYTGSYDTYTIINGYLYSVYEEDGRYYIWAYEQGGEWISAPIAVPAGDVIRPVMLREHWNELVPLLYFADMSSFYFEDFFDETSFENLIFDLDDIIDSYLAITGREREDWD